VTEYKYCVLSAKNRNPTWNEVTTHFLTMYPNWTNAKGGQLEKSTLTAWGKLWRNISEKSKKIFLQCSGNPRTANHITTVHFTTELLNLKEPFQSSALQKLAESKHKCNKTEFSQIMKEGNGLFKKILIIYSNN
jgi:hypothetical protein